MDCSPPGSVHWDSPGKNSRVGFHYLLQGIFPTQEPNPGLLHCRQVPSQLSYKGSPLLLLLLFKISLIIPLLSISASSPHLFSLGKLLQPPNWPSCLYTLFHLSPREMVLTYISASFSFLKQSKCIGVWKGWHIQALPRKLVRLEAKVSWWKVAGARWGGVTWALPQDDS